MGRNCPSESVRTRGILFIFPVTALKEVRDHSDSGAVMLMARERAARLVQEHAHEYELTWAAIRWPPENISCSASRYSTSRVSNLTGRERETFG